MNMKKILVCLSLLILVSFLLPTAVFAASATDILSGKSDSTAGTSKNSGSAASKLITNDMINQFEAAAGAEGAGYNPGEKGSAYQDPRVTIANIIRYALSFVGTLFIALTVYAGILWMTAGGNDEQVSKSKKLLFQAVIGLFITFSAYSITLLAYRVASGKYTASTCRTNADGSIDSDNCEVAN